MRVDQALIDECEIQIRAGRIHAVADRLRDLNTVQMADAFRLPLANICRRAGLIFPGLKILSPLAHPARRTAEPSAQIKAEYAVLLQRSGTPEQALRMLNEVDAREVPQAELYRVFCLFNIWEYESALPILESYLARDLAPYARLVGQVNLASSLVILGEDRRAMGLLDRTIAGMKSADQMRLRGNCLELRAQLHLRHRRLSPAEADLNEAAAILGKQGGAHDQLFVRQWLAVLEACRTGNLFAIREFKREAAAAREWESLRESDMQILSVRFDQELFEQLYFGSPWAGYRRYAERLLGRAPVSSNYVRGPAGTPCLDLETFSIGGRNLAGGELTYRLLDFLNRDFYRPKPLSAVFARLFDGEHFDVFSSPNRVHQAVRRARAWLRENGLPGLIANTGDSYYFQIEGSMSVRIPALAAAENRNELYFARLRRLLPAGAPVSRGQAQRGLGLHKTKAAELLAWAASSGRMIRSGAGKRTKYRLAVPE